MRQKKLLIERLEERSMPEPNSGCRFWLGNVNPGGYGMIEIEGRTFTVHRVAYMVYKGLIPDGLFVLHTCDVRSCIEPNHLYLGNHMDNMADMVRRKRWGKPRRK